ncbi:serine hydrolase domain-containing protein, partial [candidate division KSB1 bacterium]
YADLENSIPASGATVYRIASISKPITAICLMQLVEKGEVDLQDDIRKYVPAFPKKRWTITLWHLMTHTSGIRHYNSGEFGVMEHFEKFEDTINIFKDDTLKFEPGTRYSYSTYGFNLLQGVIESVSTRSFERYLSENIWIPSGMLSAGIELKEKLVLNRARGYNKTDGRVVNARYTDVSIKYAAGGMIASVEDLVKLFNALDSGKLLPENRVQEMYSVQYQRRNPGNGSGLSWSVNTDSNGRKRVSHSGGAMGFRSMLINFPDEKIIIAVISNQDFMGVGTIANNIASFYIPPQNR